MVFLFCFYIIYNLLPESGKFIQKSAESCDLRINSSHYVPVSFVSVNLQSEQYSYRYRIAVANTRPLSPFLFVPYRTVRYRIYFVFNKKIPKNTEKYIFIEMNVRTYVHKGFLYTQGHTYGINIFLKMLLV